MKIQKKIIDKCFEAKKIAVFVHKDPDGDCLGASSALKLAMERLGKMVDVYSPTKVPDSFSILHGFDKILTCDVDKNYDLMIALDSSESKRLGKFEQTFLEFVNTIVIDHHQNNLFEKGEKFVATECAAVCEILYFLLKELDVDFLTKEVADCLFLGLVTDTGNFMYSNTTVQTLKVMLETVKAGADRYAIINKMFRIRTKKSFDAMRFMYQNMMFITDELVYFELPYSYAKKKGYEKGDVSGFSSMMIECEGIQMSIFAYGISNTELDVSIRSQVGYDASAVATKFGGGGHKCASGCKIANNKKMRNNLIESALQEIEKCKNLE